MPGRSIRKTAGEAAALVPIERIERTILLLRGEKVMLDADLAALYGVSTKRLNEQAKRNRDRFPPDFLFRLTWDEAQALRSQSATLNGTEAAGSRSRSATLKRGHNIKYRPYAFTEHGAIMAANVLNSARPVQMSVMVVRAFVRLRQMVLSHAELARRLDALERKYDAQFKVVFDAIRELMAPAPAKGRIGFRAE